MMAAGVVLRHGVDGEIAAPEVVLELHVRRELGREAAIAGRHLALQARERVFFLGLRMQEHREIASDGNESRARELGRRGADHHPVALGHLAPEQPVPNRAAHQVHLHGAHVNHSYCSRTHCLPGARQLRHHLRGPGGQGPAADPHRPQADHEGPGGPGRGRPAQAAPRGGARSAGVRLARARAA